MKVKALGLIIIPVQELRHNDLRIIHVTKHGIPYGGVKDA